MFYDIPMQFKSGEFKFKELPRADKNNALRLEYNKEYEILEYDMIKWDGTARIYSVPKNAVKDTLVVAYDGNDELERIELSDKNKTRLVYIRYVNMKDSRDSVLKFIRKQAKRLSHEIMKRNEMLSRIFIESFYDGDAVDIAVKTATPEEMKAVIDENGGDTESADYSGNFPVESRIEIDRETLRVMLLCTSEDYRDTLFSVCAVDVKEYIEKHVLDNIDKTEDFKFICEAYD
ncbi:MAG: hypothetical protein K2N06_04535 [Oscillospiraceae bacterium]|nr:hypothetical protein [Oscillospiraceae bacterium]